MHDELDSGERRAQKLEIQFERILTEIEHIPERTELAVMKAIGAHEKACNKAAKLSIPPQPSPKMIKALIGAIVALAGAITALATLPGCGADKALTPDHQVAIKSCTDICARSDMLIGCFTDFQAPDLTDFGDALTAVGCIGACSELYLEKEELRDRIKCLGRAQSCEALKWCDETYPR